MAAPEEQRPQSRLEALAEGRSSVFDLPLESNDFWADVVRTAASRPKRLRRAPDSVTIAQRLLEQTLPDSAASARVSAALDAMKSPEARVRRVAMHALTRADSPEAEEAADVALDDPDMQVRVAAVRVLEHRQTPGAIERLAKALEETTDIRATLAAEALVQCGAKAVPALGRLLDSGDDGVRWRATDCLARLRTPKALPELLRSFHDESQDIAWTGADGLLALGPTASVEVLRSVLANPITPPVVSALRHYAEHAAPRQVFHPVFEATIGLGARAAIPMAVENALDALRKK